MEKILQIIYDKSINNIILNLKDIEKILELLVIEKSLNDYILDISFQQIRSNNLASYSTYTKKVTIYIKKVEQMVKNIGKNLLNVNDFESTLYKNLSILQILLHEVEHANQQKIAYKENSLEALIIRLSFLVNDRYNKELYEYCPEERLAEIKSFDEINNLINYLTKKTIILPEILETEKLKRFLRGYHYKDSLVNVPIIDFFSIGNKQELLKAFEFSNNIKDEYTLNERFKYGYPISVNEYGSSMKKLVISINKNFNNRINIK